MIDGEQTEILLVTGMSGAGKTTTAGVLSDLGWFVVDNLPATLLARLVDTVTQDGARHERIAVGVDVRGGELFAQLREARQALAERHLRPHLLYLEAGDEVLVRRYDLARRPHPLMGDGRVLDGIRTERGLVAGLRGDADLVIDTSDLNVHQLAARVRSAFSLRAVPFRTIIVTFGFKYGLPLDADIVLDMRFLPNPHWVPKLRPQTGQDAPVRDYVLNQPGAVEFLDRCTELLQLVGRGYRREGKMFSTAGIGCTGGRHRSVAMAEALAARLRDAGVEVLVIHRDLGRE